MRFLRGESQNVRADVPAPDAGGGRPARLRAGRQVPQPPVGAGARHRRPGHQSRRHRGGRRVRRLPGWRADLRPGVLLPLRPELGQPRLLPARRSHACRRGGAGKLHRPVLRRQAGAAPAFCCRTRCRAGSCSPMRCPPRPSAASRSACRSAAPRPAWSSTRCRTRARRWDASWRKAPRSCTLLEGLQERFELPRVAAPHRGVRQQPHPGQPTRSAP